ncbi:GNAT family N-acetyltransferase [Streptomyces sp. NPDC002574]|uniref:GNAT family N-acetyltransferase n=1 Tax=Streptomyces sp. NPDC002574 TaxID=3364652 RepID=UPI0036B53ABE
MERLTPRLRLRAWREADLDPLAAINADPEVMRFIADGSTRTREETAAQLERFRREGRDRHEHREHGPGAFAVEVRGTGELAGWVALTVPAFLPEILPAVEIGWRLGRAHWGRGYATEAARSAMEFAFTEAGLDRLVSVCHVDHHASARVMAKLGMTLDRTTTVPAHGQPVRVTAITRERYAAASHRA